MMNSLGQEAAPFKLLIAVIVMGFVIFAGMNAMEQLWLQNCFGKTDAKLEEFKTVLETVVSQKSPKTINFRLSSCFNENDEVIKVADSDVPEVCANYCNAPKKLCTLLEYSNSGSKGKSMRYCLNIPPDTAFPSQTYAGGKCPQKDDYELQNFDDVIPQGDYLLVNKAVATDTFPTICAYKRKE